MKHPRTSVIARAARERTGLTRPQFARLIWSTTRAIANWEDGDKPPSGATERLLVAIRDGLDLAEVERI